MLNSVSDTVRRRLSADDRRRQLVGIGLSRIIDTPIQDLSMDQIAAEAGISRGLLFHYFPTKTDFYLACIAAAGRRILRNTAPAEASTTGPVQVRTMVTAMIEQIDRRREFYLTLVHGSGVADPRLAEVHESVRSVSTDRVVAALGLDPGRARGRARLVGLRGGPRAQLERRPAGRAAAHPRGPGGALRAGAGRALRPGP